ncbi:Uncharacterized protein PBTT_06754 [Plasmodiophora brassicae]|uniref:Uncharacterized protein n=1 Tax=Plasmodiophora brassicae TaxID=37360 RepID=A0A3P3YBA7_PLABS|nr:unnamed protein product [Plasmodiophora brassicae]
MKTLLVAVAAVVVVSTVESAPDGQVLVYGKGRLQDSFICPPWGRTRYVFHPEFIDWEPCEWSGLTFYNTAKKYMLESVDAVRIVIQTSVPLALSLRLHNVGVDMDVYKANFQLEPDSAPQNVTLPIPIRDPQTKFDQVIVADSVGRQCRPGEHATVFSVVLIGKASVENDFVRSYNGVEVQSGSASDAAGQPSSHIAAKSDALPAFISAAVWSAFLIAAL